VESRVKRFRHPRFLYLFSTPVADHSQKTRTRPWLRWTICCSAMKANSNAAVIGHWPGGQWFDVVSEG